MRLPSIAAVAFLMSCAAVAATPADAPKSDVRARIAERLDVRPEDVRPSPVPGLFEVVAGTEVGYVSADGRFYIDGDLFDMETRANLTEESRKAGRVALLKGVRDEDTIVFAPKGYKYTVNVFTDVDCGYCRKLHAEIAELNRLGVKVRYLMYPRNGPGTEAWKKAEAVWCSADRNDALTRAKRGEAVTSKACDTPVASQYALGQELGIRGTPGIITDRGDYVAGYMPAQRLVDHLKTLAEKT
jgi:thiol:disulfide interchange protein DsbC